MTSARKQFLNIYSVQNPASVLVVVRGLCLSSALGVVTKHPSMYRALHPDPVLIVTKEMENTAAVSEEYSHMLHGIAELRLLLTWN